MKKRLMILLLPAALFALAMGCGKDEPTGPTGPPPPTTHTLTISNNCGTVVQIFIDNQDKGFVQSLQSRTFNLTEGGHTITFQDQTGQVTFTITMDQNLTLPTCG